MLDAYDWNAPLVGAVRYGCGHINDTFCVHSQPKEGDGYRFILQRASKAAFPRPEEWMENVISVTGRPGRDLDRCRTQFKLVADVERDWQPMHAIIGKS